MCSLLAANEENAGLAVDVDGDSSTFTFDWKVELGALLRYTVVGCSN